MISLVLGLGNIGADYAETRHNVGFEVLFRVEEALKAERRPSTVTYDWATARCGEREILLAWPRTYMNRSGMAAEALLQQANLSPSEMLVVVDDRYLPLGSLRFRRQGSDGGHNGLWSLIETLRTQQFPRLRLGIGPKPDGVSTVDFVLQRFAENEIEPARTMIATAAEAVVFAIDHRLELAMSTYNSSPALPDEE